MVAGETNSLSDFCSSNLRDVTWTVLGPHLLLSSSPSLFNHVTAVGTSPRLWVESRDPMRENWRPGEEGQVVINRFTVSCYSDKTSYRLLKWKEYQNVLVTHGYCYGNYKYNGNLPREFLPKVTTTTDLPCRIAGSTSDNIEEHISICLLWGPDNFMLIK